MATERLVLLGVDHAEYSRLAVSSQAGGRTAAVISVGGEYVRMRKGDLLVPNEDTCVAIDDGERTLVAVCDGHHGHWASHGLAEGLALLEGVPPDPLAVLRTLGDLVQDLSGNESGLPGDLLDARSTLLVAVVDRARGRVFGVSFGDSSVFVVGTKGVPVRGNRKDERYVSPWDPGSMDPRGAREFVVEVAAGDLVVVCTDGVDECHYHAPETSVGPEQLWNVRLEAGADPVTYGQAVGELALRGVGGNPGGQDNLVVVVSRV